jgi:hypothetical protein
MSSRALRSTLFVGAATAVAVAGLATVNHAANAQPGCPSHQASGGELAITPSGPGQAHVGGWAKLCGRDLGSIPTVLAYNDQKRSMTLDSAPEQPDPMNYTLDMDVVVPVGTRRVCLHLTLDYATACYAVRVDVASPGVPTVPEVGGRVSTADTHHNLNKPPPKGPLPVCGGCWLAEGDSEPSSSPGPSGEDGPTGTGGAAIR